MRAADLDILTLPGWTNSGPDHWMSRWERKLSSARRVEQADWDTPVLADWVETIVAAVANAERPVVLVAHSCGVTAAVHAAPRFTPGRVVGAFLVAPPHLEGSDLWPAARGGFVEAPMTPLPFPTEVVASVDDPHCSFAQASAYADAWGAKLRNAGNSGHINTASGHGPWPEGSLAFALFLKSLS